KNMRALVLAVGALVMVAACGRVPGGQVSPGGYKVYEAAATGSTQQLSIIDSHSQSVERSMPLGTPSPDWTHLYTVKGDLLVDLEGYYQFDAVNDGGGRVYLIQYLSNSQYYVRFYNVPARTLDLQIVFDKSDGLNAMAGTRLSGVPSRDDQYLYSLYVRSDGTA